MILYYYYYYYYYYFVLDVRSRNVLNVVQFVEEQNIAEHVNQQNIPGQVNRFIVEIADEFVNQQNNVESSDEEDNGIELIELPVDSEDSSDEEEEEVGMGGKISNGDDSNDDAGGSD